MDIFSNTEIIDEDNNKHILFSKYYMDGETYYITKDYQVYSKNGEQYKRISKELEKEIFDKIRNLTLKTKYEFYEKNNKEMEL